MYSAIFASASPAKDLHASRNPGAARISSSRTTSAIFDRLRRKSSSFTTISRRAPRPVRADVLAGLDDHLRWRGSRRMARAGQRFGAVAAPEPGGELLAGVRGSERVEVISRAVEVFVAHGGGRLAEPDSIREGEHHAEPAHSAQIPPHVDAVGQLAAEDRQPLRPSVSIACFRRAASSPPAVAAADTTRGRTASLADDVDSSSGRGNCRRC